MEMNETTTTAVLSLTFAVMLTAEKQTLVKDEFCDIVSKFPLSGGVTCSIASGSSSARRLLAEPVSYEYELTAVVRTPSSQAIPTISLAAVQTRVVASTVVTSANGGTALVAADIKLEVTTEKISIVKGQGACPSNSVALSALECKSLADGKAKPFKETSSRRIPRDCVYKGGKYYFNAHATGSPQAAVVCKTGEAGGGADCAESTTDTALKCVGGTVVDETQKCAAAQCAGTDFGDTSARCCKEATDEESYYPSGAASLLPSFVLVAASLLAW